MSYRLVSVYGRSEPFYVRRITPSSQLSNTTGLLAVRFLILILWLATLSAIFYPHYVDMHVCLCSTWRRPFMQHS
ncbi:hypothetical protein BDV41DRAFT_541507 [Aspergillus transmontanensis]|uniref:Uncharacterized protein n=1 Tax=Aspergillus transmontanensis TaxID=1034304 RepID=A0A5N6VSN9_9EURO|nr:hypothetical protein BDV41DRAFT_541507 [Aspergillus transmontanensis]